jgi:hypothetical protein
MMSPISLPRMSSVFTLRSEATQSILIPVALFKHWGDKAYGRREEYGGGTVMGCPDLLHDGPVRKHQGSPRA